MKSYLFFINATQGVRSNLLYMTLKSQNERYRALKRGITHLCNSYDFGGRAIEQKSIFKFFALLETNHELIKKSLKS